MKKTKKTPKKKRRMTLAQAEVMRRGYADLSRIEAEVAALRSRL